MDAHQIYLCPFAYGGLLEHGGICRRAQGARIFRRRRLLRSSLHRPHGERLEAIGKKLARRRRAWEERYGEQNAVPPLVQAALDNLRAVAAKRLESDEDAEARIVEILARSAQDIRGS